MGLGNKETSMCPNEDLVHPKRPGNGFEGERGGTPGRVPGMLVSRSLMHSFVRKMGLSEPIVNSPVQAVMARRIEATDDKAAIQSKSVLAECSIRTCCICDPGVIWLIDEHKYCLQSLKNSPPPFRDVHWGRGGRVTTWRAGLFAC